MSAKGARHIQTVLKRAINRLCSNWSMDDREDLLQNAMLRLYQQSEGEDIGEYQSSYLYRVAHSVVVDEVRKRSRRPAISSESDILEQIAQEHEERPDQWTAASDAREALWDCMRRLAESRRAALVLYLQGHSVPEAAELLGWPRKRTENCIYRGLTDLRQCLTSKEVNHVLV